nr:hypothetical protein [uncultured Campylobacter sp.]
MDYKILLHEALCFKLPLCFEISLCLDKSSYSKILSRFEIPLYFKILSRRPEILRGGLNEILRRKILHGRILYFKFYGLGTSPCAYRLSIYRILSSKI